MSCEYSEEVRNKKRKSKCFAKKLGEEPILLLNRSLSFAGDRHNSSTTQEAKRKIGAAGKSKKHSFTIKTIFSIIRNFCPSRCRMGNKRKLFSGDRSSQWQVGTNENRVVKAF